MKKSDEINNNLIRNVISFFLLILLISVIIIKFLFFINRGEFILDYGSIIENIIVYCLIFILTFWHIFLFEGNKKSLRIAVIITLLIGIGATIYFTGPESFPFKIIFLSVIIILFQIYTTKLYNNKRIKLLIFLIIIFTLFLMVYCFIASGNNYKNYAAADIPQPNIAKEDCWRLKLIPNSDWIYEKCIRENKIYIYRT